MKITVAIAQAAPRVLDLPGSVVKAVEWIAEAGRLGARVLAFPETWLPCYPVWCDWGPFSQWGNPAAKRLQSRLAANSIAADSKEMAALQAAARKAGVGVVMGANERESRCGSLFNSLFFIGANGEILGRHRKLTPTHAERLVWAPGDASGLRAYTEAGTRIGGLVCWEHWMPLSRQVLHAEGEAVHVAAWPQGREMYQIASRHYAFEGRAYVLLAAAYLRRADFPADFEMAADLAADSDPLLNGGSAVIGPDGEYVAGPVFGEEKLLAAEIELDRTIEEKLTLDVAGHYSRPDVFDLRVDRRPRPQFRDSDQG